jgi:hypothetical protein
MAAERDKKKSVQQETAPQLSQAQQECFYLDYRLCFQSSFSEYFVTGSVLA